MGYSKSGSKGSSGKKVSVLYERAAARFKQMILVLLAGEGARLTKTGYRLGRREVPQARSRCVQ